MADKTKSSIAEQIDVLKEELDQQDLESVSGGAADIVICSGGCFSAKVS